ncbi:MAG TPA: OPT/YSL family transporter [Chitinophaga sp.]|uniref:OPT family oligopeptide transporter n=1 Tax=Chitinophaga sp. TaxID=1869181 RepID=UPI002DB67135|nr:OPT/YSL family transporter [Chitinophaga sp.]HEU4553281.1 OPT/YSL family transporter [Chitinophaga sp.]
MADSNNFKPFVAPDVKMKEFTVKSIVLGCIFGIIFGAATVYLALKAGLTVTASIPIAVIAITLGRKFFKTTILENNIIQTTGSAGETIAGGVAFTLPGFLFLSAAGSADYFDYITIFILAIFGGILGTLMMIPLRRALIVKEHGILPYPEGTACGDVLIAGEKGGEFAKTAFYGLGFAFVYAILQKILHIIAETPFYMTKQANKFFPSARVSADITPEYMGIGYIIGPRIGGVLVGGGVLAWLAIIPLLATLVPADVIASQLVKLGYLASLTTPGGQGGWDPATHTFANYSSAIYYAYVRQIAAGTVAAGGFIALIKTIPTIISSFKGSISSLGREGVEVKAADVPRTERDLNIKVVLIGSILLVLLMAFLPQLPGNSIGQKLLIGLLVVIFGAFFVTVSSRIVGLIGTSNNPISGMTIATLMGTCLVFIAIGWTGQVYAPMALVVGGMICIAAANAGGTSQDLKSGYIVGATPRHQQIALFIGAIVSSIVIGLTIKFLDKPTADMISKGMAPNAHAIGSIYFPAPQSTLMATLINGILGSKLDWQFIVVGVFLAITMELCGIKSLSFAIGAYLPLSTTLPIFIGSAIRGIVDQQKKKKNIHVSAEEEELGKGNLFATGLVAGGAVAGVVIAVLAGIDATGPLMSRLNLEEGMSSALGQGGYFALAVAFFAFMGYVLYRIARQQQKVEL